jgi:hypothetical protein
MRLRREKKSDAVQEERPRRARLLRAVVVVAVPVAIVTDEGTVAIATEDEKTVEIIETEETETVAIATTGTTNDTHLPKCSTSRMYVLCRRKRSRSR